MSFHSRSLLRSELLHALYLLGGDSNMPNQLSSYLYLYVLGSSKLAGVIGCTITLANVRHSGFRGSDFHICWRRVLPI